jgi:hypothetical protein
MNFKNVALAFALFGFVASTMPASQETAEITNNTATTEEVSLTEKALAITGIGLIFAAAYYCIATADSESLIKLAESRS